MQVATHSTIEQMKERMRNRFKLYPAPKATISLKIFKKAIASRKQAEAQDAPTWPDNNQESSVVCISGAVEGIVALADDLASSGAQDLSTEALDQEGDAIEDGSAASARDHDQQRAASSDHHWSQHLKLQEKAKRRAERQAQAEEAWKQQESARIQKLEEQLKAREEVEMRKERRAEELQALRTKLEALKVEKQDMVAQLKQVLLTEDSEKARAAALAALEEGEVLVEPFLLPPPQGMPHLAPIRSVGSSTHPSSTCPQLVSLAPSALSPLQRQGSSAGGLPLHMSQPLAAVGSGRLHSASHVQAPGRLPPHLAASHPSRPSQSTPFGVPSLPPHLQN